MDLADITKKDVKLQCHPIGCSITGALIHFPRTTIGPMMQGLKAFIARKQWILSLSKSHSGSRLLEALVSASSPLEGRMVQRLIRCVQGSFSDLGTNKWGGFVVTAFYRASAMDLKKIIVEELVKDGTDFKVSNPAIYHICELAKYVKDDKAWEEKENRKTKTRELFKDLIAEDTPVKKTRLSN